MERKSSYKGFGGTKRMKFEIRNTKNLLKKYITKEEKKRKREIEEYLEAQKE